MYLDWQSVTFLGENKMDPLLTVIIELLKQAADPQFTASSRQASSRRAKTLLERADLGGEKLGLPE